MELKWFSRVCMLEIGLDNLDIVTNVLLRVFCACIDARDMSDFVQGSRPNLTNVIVVSPYLD